MICFIFFSQCLADSWKADKHHNTLIFEADFIWHKFLSVAVLCDWYLFVMQINLSNGVLLQK